MLGELAARIALLDELLLAGAADPRTGSGSASGW